MADTPNDSINNSIADYIEAMSLDVEGTLKSIDLTLRAIARQDGLLISQSSLQDLVAAEQEANERSQQRTDRNNTDRRGAYADRFYRSQTSNAKSQEDQRNRAQQDRQRRQTDRYTRGDSFNDLFNNRRRKSAFDDALDGFEKALTKSLFDKVNPVSDIINSSVENLAKKLGTDVNHLSGVIGAKLGKRLGQAFDNTAIGRRLKAEWNSILNRFGASVNGAFGRFGDWLAGIDASDVQAEMQKEEQEQPNPAEQSAAQAQQSQAQYRRVDADIIDAVQDADGTYRAVRQTVQAQAGKANEPSPEEAQQRAAAADAQEAASDRINDNVSDLQASAEASLGTISTNLQQLTDIVNSGFTRLFEILDQNPDIQDTVDDVVNDVTSTNIDNLSGVKLDESNLNALADAVRSTTNEAAGSASRDSEISTFTNEIVSADASISDIASTAGEVIDGLAHNASRTGAALAKASKSASTSIVTTAESAGTAIETVAVDTTAGLGQVGAGASAAAGVFPGLTLAMFAADTALGIFKQQLKSSVEPLKEGWSDFVSGVLGAANRTYTQTKENLTNWQKRQEADIASIRQAEFDIIKEAANRVTDVWDSIVTTVTATQGYDKAGVQDLWSNYAQRLTTEGLASVVSSADIMDKLNSVLQRGLSGQVAEEFAYIATKLGSAIPTEDFFQYAETYASIAANAIRQGASQEEALAKANDELTSFASNLLYASRQVAGGFSTSLTNAAELFEDSAKIAMTSAMTGGGGDVSNISGVLTAVAAAVGSIAPDLASSLISTVTSLATGGNSSELTALRSLAGVGASNSAFLKELSANPQKVFADMFGKLAELQNMSADNFMEVSEGLSSVFGMSMDAFARIDFAYLADAIASMDVNNTAWKDSLAMLASGQTTSTESQLRMQKINEYMVEEGLAYVLDNEVARSIQQHMWDEQLANDLKNSTYAVELVGGTASLINGIKTTVQKVLDTILPSRWVGKIIDIVDTVDENSAQRLEIEDILNYGKVGKGNSDAQYNLLHGGTDLGLTESYLDLISKGQARTDLQRTAEVKGEKLETVSKILSTTVPGMTAISSAYNEQLEALSSTTSTAINDFTEGVTNVVSEAATDKLSQLSQSSNEIVALTARGLLNAVNTVNDAASLSIEHFADGVVDKVTGVAVDKMTQLAQSSNTVVSKVAKGMLNMVGAINNATSESTKDITSKYIWATVGKGAYQQRIEQAQQASAEFYARNSESGIWKSREDALNEMLQQQQSATKALFTSLDESLTTYITTRTADTTTTATKQTAIVDAAQTSSFAADTMAYSTQMVVDSNGQLVEAMTQQHRDFYTQAELIQQVTEDTAARAEADMLMSFDDWVSRFEQDWNKQQGTTLTGYRKIEDILADYGSDISMLERAYSEMETSQNSAAIRARELHEVQFWEDMQQFATRDFPWYMREWERYYIQHEAYGQVTAQAYGTESDYAGNGKTTNSQSIGALFSAEQDEQGDAVIALAKVLTDNSMWQQEFGNALKDPTLQTNALLAKILIVVEAIMQQNNETSIVSVPTSLSSLGLGVTNI